MADLATAIPSSSRDHLKRNERPQRNSDCICVSGEVQPEQWRSSAWENYRQYVNRRDRDEFFCKVKVSVVMEVFSST